jgi:hypothetical protein
VNETGMPTEQVKTIVKSHRPALVVGLIAGLALIVGVVGYQVAMTPAMPVLPKAAASEVVEYIANPRGFSRLAQVQQRQFLDEWRRHIAAAPARDELKDCLKGLSEDKREEFVTAIARQLKKEFMDDAKRYAQLTRPEEKGDFCRQKVAEVRAQALEFKDIMLVMKSSSSTRSDDLQQWILENTTAEERAIGEPYVDALKRVGDQMKKESRTTASAESPKS